MFSAQVLVGDDAKTTAAYVQSAAAFFQDRGRDGIKHIELVAHKASHRNALRRDGVASHSRSAPLGIFCPLPGISVPDENFIDHAGH